MPALERIAVIAGAVAFLCAVWLAAKVVGGATLQFDENVRAALHSAATPGLTRSFQWVTLLGSQAAVIGVSVCAALVLYLKGRPERALLVLIGIAGAELLQHGLKIQFQRLRPEPFFGMTLPKSYAFPSGHALLSFCLYGTLSAFAGAPVRIAAAALILGIGISRVYLGVHHATDVIAGFLIAAAWMAGVAVVYSRFFATEL